MRLSPKRYALVLIWAGYLSLGLVVATNIVIDPEKVFGTNFFTVKPNLNDRYLRYLTYRESKATFGGLFFSASRGRAIPMPLLSAHTGVNYASFAVNFGIITDHLPVLEHVIRDKEKTGDHLRQVFLLLDPDLLGLQPATNRSPQSYLHPDITGEDPIRFWIRLLTAIQFQAWKDDVRRALAPQPPNTAIAEPAGAALPATPIVQVAGFAAPPPPAPSQTPRPLQRVTTRSDYQRQLALLRHFVELCREHRVELTVATSPLSGVVAGRLDREDLAAAVADVTRITPLWDFGAPQWLSDRPKMWLDESHFSSEVGELILNRVFTGALPPDGLPFGELRQSATGSEAKRGFDNAAPDSR